MNKDENILKDFLKIAVCALIFAFLIVSFAEYVSYIKREREHGYKEASCLSFKKEHPEEQVFYGREVGCKVRRNGIWWSL